MSLEDYERSSLDNVFMDSGTMRDRLISASSVDQQNCIQKADNTLENTFYSVGSCATIQDVESESKRTCSVHASCTNQPEFRFFNGSFYGSTGTEPPSLMGMDGRMPSGANSAIYCIHGQPEGCCATLVCENGQNTKEPLPRPIFLDDHCHQNRADSVDRSAKRKLIVASVLCLVFMVGEIVGGYLSSSLAIATDAAHLLTDFASFMISLFALWVGTRPPTRTMLFGWYRAEVLGALTSVLMIWVVTGILLYIAVERLISLQFELEADIMLITSAIGVFVNIIMATVLHQHTHHHHIHDTVDKMEKNESKPRQNINVRAAYIHVIGDFIQSFGVLMAALVIYFNPEWKIVDPICTFLFSILVLFTTFTILRDTMVVLMEGIPKGVDFTDVLNTFLSIDGVVKVHNLRIWALSLDKAALAAHLAVTPGINTSSILKTASREIHRKFNFFELTLQIEEFQEQMENCKQCQDPV